MKKKWWRYSTEHLQSVTFYKKNKQTDGVAKKSNQNGSPLPEDNNWPDHQYSWGNVANLSTIVTTEYIKDRYNIEGVYLPSQQERTQQLCTLW